MSSLIGGGRRLTHCLSLVGAVIIDMPSGVLGSGGSAMFPHAFALNVASERWRFAFTSAQVVCAFFEANFFFLLVASVMLSTSLYFNIFFRMCALHTGEACLVRSAE